MAKVSIIVPMYNAEKNIERCVKSICNQTFVDLEIVLVNDGSTDKTLEICTELAKTDSRILIIDTNNGGVSRARNIGLKNSSGKYVNFVDADDYLEANCISVALFRMSEDKSDFVIYGFNHIKNGKSKIVSESGYVGKANGKVFDEYIKSRYSIFVWNKLFKRNIIIKYFNEYFKNSEDFLFNSQFFANYCTVSIIPDVLYNYVSVNNYLATNYTEGNLDNLKIIVKKVCKNLDAVPKDIPRFCGFVATRTLMYIAQIKDKKERDEILANSKIYISALAKHAKCDMFKHQLAMNFVKCNCYTLAINLFR